MKKGFFEIHIIAEEVFTDRSCQLFQINVHYWNSWEGKHFFKLYIDIY